jgi:cytochrome P450 family 4
MLLSAAFLSVFTLTVVFYVAKWIKLHAKVLMATAKIPGPPRTGFLIGNLTYLQNSPEKVFKRLREATHHFYPIYRINTLHKSGVNILCPEDCEIIMSNPAHNQKAMMYDLLHSWLQFGLLTSTGEKWATRRKILTPAFHFGILQQFVSVFNEEAEKLVEELRKDCQKPYVNITPHVSQFTLKTITGTSWRVSSEYCTDCCRNSDGY